MKKASDRLKISLHGMNERAQKMMRNYLEMYCNDIAQVVEERYSHAEIIDLDVVGSKNLLEKRLEQRPSKSIIALSVQTISVDDGIIYVKKPFKIPSIVGAIKTVKKDLLSGTKKRTRINAATDDTVSKLLKLSENNLGSESEETAPR